MKVVWGRLSPVQGVSCTDRSAAEEETLQGTCGCHSECVHSAMQDVGQGGGGRKREERELRGYLSALCPWL